MASSLFDLLEVLGANMVVNVVCVLSCEGLIFSQAASGILLCSVYSQFGEASVKRCCASLYQTAIISMLQVWLAGEITLYTLPRGWHCIREFCLGDEAKRGAVFWVILHQRAL